MTPPSTLILVADHLVCIAQEIRPEGFLEGENAALMEHVAELLRHRAQAGAR